MWVFFSQIGLQLQVSGGKEENFTRSIKSKIILLLRLKARTKFEKRNREQFFKEEVKARTEHHQKETI